jgi:hydroxyacylglutathione hydrolase
MICRQLAYDDLGAPHTSSATSTPASVDPRFEIDEYLGLARYIGVRIEHILETHNHADHVSGHGPLAAATGATIHIHRDACPEYEHEPFDDGWELELEAIRVRALHIPDTAPSRHPSR